MNITIQGPPIPQKRHRTYMRGKISITFDPCTELKKKTISEIKRSIEMVANGVHYPLFGQGEEIHVSLTFYMPIPKSWPNSKKKTFKKIPYINKPDLDNLCKYYLDCMTDIILYDDKQVTKLICSKLYDENPRTVIEIICLKSIQEGK